MTADQIAAALARATFKDCLVVVDRCTWTGDEADLLVVTRNLRVVDVEVKISRADLKADRRKDKWRQHGGPMTPGPDGVWRRPEPAPRDWPRSTWKHYYAMPAAIWRDDLLDHCGAASGVLLLREAPESREEHCQAHADGFKWTPPPWPWLRVVRRAKPCSTAKPISAADAVAIARLASLRMWDAYAARDRAAADAAEARRGARDAAAAQA
jgi:hypothetical protein